MLRNIETQMMKKALERARGVKKEAARLLGLSFRSFRYRLQKLGLGDSSDSSEEDDA